MGIKKFWIKDKKYILQLEKKEKDCFLIEIAHKKIKAQIIKNGSGKQPFFLQINNLLYKAKILEKNTKQAIIYIFNFNKTFTVNLEQPNITGSILTNKSYNHHFTTVLKSPLSGKVIKIPVKPNQYIKNNQTLIIIESMKMENEIRAINDAFIKNILISESDLIKTNQILMTFAKKRRD